MVVLVNAHRALSFNTARRGGGDQGDAGLRNHIDPAHSSGVLVLEDVAVKRLAAAIPDHLEANLAVGVCVASIPNDIVVLAIVLDLKKKR